MPLIRLTVFKSGFWSDFGLLSLSRSLFSITLGLQRPSISADCLTNSPFITLGFEFDIENEDSLSPPKDFQSFIEDLFNEIDQPVSSPKEYEKLRDSIRKLEAEPVEETFRGKGEFRRLSNISFLSLTHLSSVHSDTKESKIDEESSDAFELEDYFEELSNLDDTEIENPLIERCCIDQPIIEAVEKSYEDIIRNADFAIGDAMSLNLQMRTQWFKDLTQPSICPPKRLHKRRGSHVGGLYFIYKNPFTIV